MNPRGLRRSIDSIDNEWSAPHHGAPDAPDGERTTEQAGWQVNAAGREVVEMSAAEIVTKLRAGELNGQALAWRDGMEEWTALDALPVFQLAAPQSSRPLSSRPAESEARLKQTEDALADTEMTAPRAQISIPEDVPSDEATVVRDPETLPPPPFDDTNPGSRDVLAVYERPIATLAFPELDAPSDEETIVSELGPESSEPPKGVKVSEPPVPPLPKLPSRALVSTAASTFLPPSNPPPRSSSGAPRLSSLGPSTGARPSSPSSPAIVRKPLAPASGALGPAATPAPAPLVQALLTLAESSSVPPPGHATTKPSAITPEPSTEKKSAPPAPPARTESSSYRAPLRTEVGLGPPPPSISVKDAVESVKPPLAAKAAPAPATTTPVASPLRSTQPGTPAARFKSLSTAPAAPAPAPAPAAAQATASARPAAPKAPPPIPSAPPSASIEAELLPPSDPDAAAPPPPLPAREAVAVIAAHGTPTIILREDRDADTLITNFRPRTVRIRHAVMACAASAVVASLLTVLVMPSPTPVVRVVEKRVPVPVAAAPAPPVVEAPLPNPPAETAPAPAPEATAAPVPRQSARQLAIESKPERETRTTPAPRRRVAASTLDDPERALPDAPETTPARAPSGDETSATPDPDATAKSRSGWQSSPGF